MSGVLLLWKGCRRSADDPNYAAAYAGLADSYPLLGYYGIVAPKDVFLRAKAAVLKALELEDTLSEVHTSLALITDYYDWDSVRGGQEFQAGALELNPNSAMAHLWYSYHLVWIGNLEAATSEAKRAQEVDPLALVTSTSVWLEKAYQVRDSWIPAITVDPPFQTAPISVTSSGGSDCSLANEVLILRIIEIPTNCSTLLTTLSVIWCLGSV